MSERDGGPAFPVICENGLGHISDGMSLRDWYAGLALSGLIAENKSGFSSEYVADWAYKIADAMLKARGGK